MLIGGTTIEEKCEHEYENRKIRQIYFILLLPLLLLLIPAANVVKTGWQRYSKLMVTIA
jgi:hypothetical protein